jgi:hypothetical protein
MLTSDIAAAAAAAAKLKINIAEFRECASLVISIY